MHEFPDQVLSKGSGEPVPPVVVSLASGELYFIVLLVMVFCFDPVSAKMPGPAFDLTMLKLITLPCANDDAEPGPAMQIPACVFALTLFANVDAPPVALVAP